MSSGFSHSYRSVNSRLIWPHHLENYVSSVFYLPKILLLQELCFLDLGHLRPWLLKCWSVNHILNAYLRSFVDGFQRKFSMLAVLNYSSRLITWWYHKNLSYWAFTMTIYIVLLFVKTRKIRKLIYCLIGWNNHLKILKLKLVVVSLSCIIYHYNSHPISHVELSWALKYQMGILIPFPISHFPCTSSNLV